MYVRAPLRGHDSSEKNDDRQPFRAAVVGGNSGCYCFEGFAGAIAVAIVKRSRWFCAFSSIVIAF